MVVPQAEAEGLKQQHQPVMLTSVNKVDLTPKVEPRIVGQPK